MKRIKFHIPYLMVLLIPVLIYHRDIWLFGHVICGGDFINQFVPWRKFALEELANGRFPWWNPYVFSGTPFFANIQNSLFYPWNVFHLIFPLEITFSLSLVFHHALAAGGMYLFLHRLFASKSGAVLGAVVYAWSGFLITHAHDGHLIHVRAYALIPFALYFQSLWRNGITWKRFVMFTASCALMFYAGHTQIPLYIFYLLVFRSFWWAWNEFRSSGYSTKIWKYPAYTMLGLLAAIIVSLPVLLPLYQLSQHTAGRAGGADYAFATSDSMPPSHIITLLAPFFYGDPTAAERESQFWETRTGYHEISGYTGVIPFILFCLAWTRKKKSASSSFKQSETVFFIWLCLFGVFFSLGKYNPLYSVLYYGFPGWSYFRVPGRLLLLWIVGLPVCTARGWQIWNSTRTADLKEKSAFKTAVVCSALVAVFAIVLFISKASITAWLRDMEVNRTLAEYNLPNSSRLNVSLQLPQILFDTRYEWMMRSTLLACFFLAGGWVVLLLKRRFRLRWLWAACALLLVLDFYTFSHRFIETRPLDNWRNTYFPPSELVQFLQEQAQGYRVLCLDDAIGYPGLEHHPELRPNRLMYYGIETTRGYDPLILKSYARMINRMYGKPEDTAQGGLLFFPYIEKEQHDWLNKMNIRYIVTSTDLPQPFLKVWQETKSNVKIFENPDYFERFYWEAPSASNTVKMISTSPSQVTVEVETASVNKLVWSQSYYPGWDVWINGEKTAVELYLDNYISVLVPVGKHQVMFEFHPL